jgi:hypothetical protein
LWGVCWGVTPPPPPPLCISMSPKGLVLKKPLYFSYVYTEKVPVRSKIREEQYGEFVELEPEHDDSVHHGGTLAHVE